VSRYGVGCSPSMNARGSSVWSEEAEAVVAHVRPRRLVKGRCGRCGKRAPGYDQGEGRRRWRSLDVGEIRSFVEADAPRVDCAEHGPTVILFPWARHADGHTRAFDDVVAWLRCTRPRRRSSSWCASPGRRWGPSCPGSSTRPGRPRTLSTASAESASTRSLTSAGTATSPSSSTTTRAGWCGRQRATTRRRWRLLRPPGPGPLRPRSAGQRRCGRVDRRRRR
jgi:hypothetical protein